nr:carbon-nitrogen hydrolase family protein [Candidatus Levybacteria bacterium]
MKKLTALCQLNPLLRKPEDNFNKVEQVIKEHSSQKILLFIFPEDFLYGILRGREEIKDAGKKFNFWIKRFSVLAVKYNIDIIPGSFPLFAKGKLFNTTVYINKKGQLLNQYSKTNLWLSEREEYSPSLVPPKVFNSILGKTIQIICWDLMDHKLFEEAVRQGAEWVINVSLWSLDQSRDLSRKRGKTKNKYSFSLKKSERLNSIIETRTTEYNIGIIFCNIGGNHSYIALGEVEQLARSAGSTQAIAPLDGVRINVKNRKEQVLICNIPDIKDYISDHEIFYGRRKDVKNNYPHSTII